MAAARKEWEAREDEPCSDDFEVSVAKEFEPLVGQGSVGTVFGVDEAGMGEGGCGEWAGFDWGQRWEVGGVRGWVISSYGHGCGS